MKRINNINKSITIIVLFIMVSIVSCADLSEDPIGNGKLSPEGFFVTTKDIESGVSSAFSRFHTSLKTAHNFIALEGSDDITTHKASNKADFREFDSYKASPANNWLAEYKWDPLWASIQSANAVINGWQSIEGSNNYIETEVKPAAAIAYYIRALAYFDLVRLWGDLPLLTTSLSTGEETRSPVQDVYDLIYEDLDFAESYLPDTYGGGIGIGKPTKWAAKALLAKIYLTNAGWPLKDNSKYDLAAKKAKEIIDSGRFHLKTNFKDLWAEDNGTADGSEAIFVFRMCGSCSNVPGAWAPGGKTNFLKIAFTSEDEGGFEDVLAEIQFFKDFPEGPRKDATYYVTAAGKPWEELRSGRPLFAKYGPQVGSIWAKSDQDIYISRYADVLLMYAEASNKALNSPSPEAYDAINSVRQRAGLSDLENLPSDAFHKAVIAERGWEFAAEYTSRWFDLIRNEMVEEAAAHRDPDENGYGNPVSKDNYLAPIPIRDISLNTNLTQNPGY